MRFRYLSLSIINHGWESNSAHRVTECNARAARTPHVAVRLGNIPATAIQRCGPFRVKLQVSHSRRAGVPRWSFSDGAARFAPCNSGKRKLPSCLAPGARAGTARAARHSSRCSPLLAPAPPAPTAARLQKPKPRVVSTHQQEGAERGADSTEETISEYELRSRTVKHNTPGGGDGGGGGGNSSSRSSRAGSATRSQPTTARASAASQSRSGGPNEPNQAILRLGIYSAGVGSPEPRGGIHLGGEAAVTAVRLSTGQQAGGTSVKSMTSVTTQRVETSQVPRGSLASFLRR